MMKPIFFLKIRDIKSGTVVVDDRGKAGYKRRKGFQYRTFTGVIIGKPLTHFYLFFGGVVPKCTDQIKGGNIGRKSRSFDIKDHKIRQGRTGVQGNGFPCPAPVISGCKAYAKGRKYVGKYAVKITFKGKYSGTKTLYFTIKPKATSISSLKAGSKKFTVKWKKQATQTTGYQVQYSASSKFSKAKTVTVGKNTTVSKKISKLSGKKKYYVRVRTYKTVKINGKSIRIYSGWSKAKTVTTKK